MQPRIDAMQDNFKRKQECIRCGRNPFRFKKANGKRKRPKPLIRFAINAVNERIAWCACLNCGKITPLKFVDAL